MGSYVLTRIEILRWIPKCWCSSAKRFADGNIEHLGGPIDGVLQEYRVFHTIGLLHIPQHLSYEEAACWPCAGVTAWNALYGGGIPLKPGQTVLFKGTGGVSLTGLILARAAGAKVGRDIRMLLLNQAKRSFCL